MSRAAHPVLRLLSIFLLWGLWTTAARADDARPVSLEVRETAPGRYEARFQTPMRGGKRLRARPRLPRGSAIVPASYDRQVIGDSSIERFAFELEGGLVGHEIGVDGLILGSRSALLRVRLRDGRDLRAVLGGARPVYRVEALPAEARASWTVGPARAARRGLRHGALEPAHLLLALGLVLAARGGGWILAFALFLLGDLGGAGLGLHVPPSLRPSPDLAEAVVALGAGLAAREALLGRSGRLLLLAALVGLVHGAAASGAVRSPLDEVARVFGLDLAHLAFGGATVLVFRVFRRREVRRASAWGVGVLAVAVAGILAMRAAPVSSGVEAPGLLPAALAGSPSPGGRATGRPPGLETDLEAYLDVGVFETRLEILARLTTLEAWFGWGERFAGEIAIADQVGLREQAAETILSHLAFTIDGEPARPDAVRSGFAVQEQTGTYLRDEPVPEDASTALLGVVYAFRTPAIPNTVAVAWSQWPPGLSEIRTRVIDPEISREVRLPADAPRLAWENTLREDPLPSVAAVRVRPHPVPLPLLSLALLGLAIGATLRFSRRRAWSAAGVCVRLGLACAFLALPFLTVDVSGWVDARSAPTSREARAIASALLENVYRAFNVREESAVYDRLALSLTEASRTPAYLASRRALAFERVGGARTHVDVVELVDLDDLEPTSTGGFTARAAWTVSGSVTHFGHRHLRRNLYRAHLAITPSDGAWKIDVFDVQDVERRQ